MHGPVAKDYQHMSPQKIPPCSFTYRARTSTGSSVITKPIILEPNWVIPADYDVQQDTVGKAFIISTGI